MKMFDVISIGSATLDVFIRSKGLEIEREGGSKDICVRYGAKIPVDEIYFESGGGGTNSAVTFARQGLKVASVVKLAPDFAGKKIKEDLAKEGVATDFCVNDEKGNTDYSTILWAPDGGRTILIYRGETKLEETEIPWEKLETKWFYVSSVEGNLKIVERLLVSPRSSGSLEGQIPKVAWNPGGGELKQKEKVAAILPGITLLNINKEEMEELLGGEGKEWEMKELLSKAGELPCRFVVITDDRNGSYLHQKGDSFWWHCGIFDDVPRVETTGAGDSFGSGLVAGIIKEFSLSDCLKIASANATSVVNQVGAKKGIIKAADINNWLNKEILMERLDI